MQCRTCGDHGNLSLLDPEHASLLPQLAAGCSVCHDCDVEIKHWSNFLTRFQTSQTHFQQVLHSNPQQTDVPLKLAECRVLVPKLLECDFCCFYSDNKTQLATHIQAHLHTPNTAGAVLRKYPLRERNIEFSRRCAQCSKLFSHPEMLAWHTENCHGTDAIVEIVKISDTEHGYQCVFCETVCKNSMDSIIRHLHLHHQINNFPFPCNVCGKRFTEYRSRNKHQLKCKNKKNVESNARSTTERIKCKMCDNCFKTEMLLNDHISNFHAKKSELNKCLYCGESFTSFPRLKSHCQSRHPGKHILQCEICKAPFNSSAGYNLHKKYQHENHVRSFTCDICKETFRSYPPYWDHKKYKHGTHVFKCHICSAILSTPKNLQRHLKNVHVGLQRPFPCNLCSAEFKCEQSLRQHMDVVHTAAVSNFQCYHCKFRTHRKPYLVQHIKNVHTLSDTKPWACKFCSLNFKCRQYLHNHVRQVHTGPILHCDLCQYNTRIRALLIRHLQVYHF